MAIKQPTTLLIGLITLFAASLATAAQDSVSIKMYKTTTKQAPGQYIGTIVAKDSQYGLILMPNLHNLPPGPHGLHVHVTPSCAQGGMAAGGHLDPSDSGQHLGPYNPYGHLGDLPPLYVTQNGHDTLPILAPRLTVATIRHHALMIHSGGDNYSDTPEKLGGGGARLACGIIPK